MHKFIKMAGCKSEAEFNRKFPTEESFFSKFPEAKYHLASGQANVTQNQSLSSPGSAEQSYDYTNVKQETKRGEDASLPRRQVGGVAGESETPFTKSKFKKSKKKMFEGGDPSYDVEIHDRNWGKIPTNNWMPPSRDYIGMESGWDGFGDDANLIQSQGMPGVYSDIKGYQNMQQHSGAALGSGDYSLDRIREQTMRMGGHLKRYQFGEEIQVPQTHPGITDIITNAPDQPINTPNINNQIYSYKPKQINPDPYAKQRAQKYTNTIPTVTPDTIAPAAPLGSSSYNQQFPITDINERPESRQHVSPFLVGAAAVTGAAGGFAAAASALGKQKTAEDFHRYAQQRGLSRNEGASGSMGDYDQFGNFKPDMRTPSQPGQFYKHGGHTWNGDMSTFFQEGGEAQGYNEGDELEVTEEQAAQLIKAGYKIKQIK